MLLRQITTPAFMLPSPAVAEKSSIFEKIQPFIGETLDFITREEEKKGVYLTKEDLVDWEKRLNKDGKFEYAFEVGSIILFSSFIACDLFGFIIC